MNDLKDMDLEALRIELAYRRALLKPDSQSAGYRARLPRRLRLRRPSAEPFTPS